MGPLSRLRGTRTYLDTNIFIYAIEEVEPFVLPLRGLFHDIDEGRLAVVTSELALAEVLVRPLRDRNPALAADYETALQKRPAVDVVAVRRDIRCWSSLPGRGRLSRVGWSGK